MKDRYNTSTIEDWKKLFQDIRRGKINITTKVECVCPAWMHAKSYEFGLSDEPPEKYRTPLGNSYLDYRASSSSPLQKRFERAISSNPHSFTVIGKFTCPSTDDYFPTLDRQFLFLYRGRKTIPTPESNSDPIFWGYNRKK